MFFNNDDDDSDFLSNTGGSKLASLFGEDKAAHQGANSTFTYTAPKEPKKTNKAMENEDGKSGGSQVLCAEPVHAFKYIDSKHESQGKLMSALLGSHAEKDYKILLYVNKQQQVTHARISSAFTFTILKDNYVTMYDQARVLWSLRFETIDKLHAFGKQVAIAKACCQGDTITDCVTQELLPGDGGQLESGDSVEIKYTTHLFENNNIGKLIETSTESDRSTRFKLGRGKTIKAWDEGLLGARAGGRRLIISPPSHAYGNEGRGKIPPNSTVVFDIEITRVKLAKGKDEQESTAEQPTTQAVAAEPDAPQTKQEESKPIKPDKAKLISRIAKMGQPMFPVPMAGAQSEGDEANDTERVYSPAKSPGPHIKPDIPLKPPHSASHAASHFVNNPASHSASQPATQSIPTGLGGVYQQPLIPPQQSIYQPQMQVPMQSQLALYQSPMQMPLQTPLGYGIAQPPQYGAYAPLPQPYQPPAPPPPVSSAHTEVALSETRQHNTEFKGTLSKVADKVDKMYDKIEAQYKESLQLSQMPSMEAGVLLHNITRIVQDNERLKNDLYEKNNKIEEQNGKINELIHRNQRYIEQSNTMLEQRSDTFKLTATQSQDKVLSLEQDKVKLTSELSATVSQVSSITMELTGLKRREFEMKTQLDSLLSSDQELRTELSSIRVSNSENEKLADQYSSQLKDEKRMRKETETKLTSLQEEFLELKTSYVDMDRSFTEKKKKSLDERKKFDSEMEDMKNKLELEIDALREKLKHEKSSTDVANTEQISKLEEDIHTQWKEKSERMLSVAQERHKRALHEVQEEKQQLEDKIHTLENKLSGLKTSRGASETQVGVLQEQLDEARVWQDKYESLRTQARTMKDRYETRIAELEQDVHKSHDTNDVTLEKGRQAQLLTQNQIVELKRQLAAKENEVKLTEASASKGQMDSEVKQIMSQVYQVLKAKFKVESRYIGGNVHRAALDTVRTVTLTLLAGEAISSLKSEPAESEDEADNSEIQLSLEKSVEDDVQHEEPSVVLSVAQNQRAGLESPSPESDAEFTTPPRSLSPHSPRRASPLVSHTTNQQPACEEDDDVTTNQNFEENATPTFQARDEFIDTTERPQLNEEAELVHSDSDGLTANSPTHTTCGARSDVRAADSIQAGASQSIEQVASSEHSVAHTDSGVSGAVNQHTDTQLANEPSKNTDIFQSSEFSQDSVNEKQDVDASGDDGDATSESENESELFKSSDEHVAQTTISDTPLAGNSETTQETTDTHVDTPDTTEGDSENSEPSPSTEILEEKPEIIEESAEVPEDESEEDLFQPETSEPPRATESNVDEDTDTDLDQSLVDSEHLNQTFETANETLLSGKSDLDSTLDAPTLTETRREPDPLFDAEAGDITDQKKQEPARKDSSTKQSDTGKSVFADDSKSKGGLFGDDDDDEGFDFVIKKSVSKSSGKKVETPKAEESDEEDYKPKPPPPPLFGSDDEEDDLDWLK